MSDNLEWLEDEYLRTNDCDLLLPRTTDQPSTLAQAQPSVQRTAALWILKTQETHRIPYATMDSIISDLQSLLRSA